MSGDFRVDIRAAFESEHEPPAPGFGTRVRTARRWGSVEADRQQAHWTLALAALLLAVAVIAVLIGGSRLQRTGGVPAGPPAAGSVRPNGPAPTGDRILGLTPISAEGAWVATDHHVFKTGNGGSSWADVTPRLAGAGIEAATFLGPNLGWVAAGSGPGPETIFRTSDGGRTWQVAAAGVATGRTILTFAGPARGWLYVSGGAALGHETGDLLITGDGGSTWNRVAGSPGRQGSPSQGFADCDKGEISIGAGYDGWITCAFGAEGVVVTHDGGQTWTLRQILPGPPSGIWVRALRSLGGRSGLAWEPGRGVYATYDAGDSWALVGPLPDGARAVSLLDGRNWLAIDASGLALTADAGVSWRHRLWSLAPEVIAISFADPLNGWAVTLDTAGRQALHRTADGGAHWSSSTTGGPS